MPREMKETGIEWIGEVPKDWDIVRLKHLIKNRQGGVWGDDEDLIDRTNNRVCIRIADFDFDNMTISKEKKFTVRNYTKKDILRCSLEKGDILLEKSGGGEKTPVGRTVIWNEDFEALYANFIERLRVNTNTTIPMYLQYCLYSFYKKGGSRLFFNQTTGLQNMDMNKLMNLLYLPTPNIDEQKKIADLLDKKCQEIEEIKETIETEIKTLDEYKKSIITEAVTKGLDKDAEMKDSGIEWIGQIPKYWSVIKGKYIFAQRNERGNNINLEQLSPTQEFGVIPQTLYEELSGMRAVKLNEKTDLNILKTIHKGDFCISLRSFQGGFEYSEYEGVVSPAYQVFYNIVEVCNTYYKYLFKEKSFIDKMNSYTMSLRDGKNISFNDFGKTKISLPPINEQKAIAEYLDHKTSAINEAIDGRGRSYWPLMNIENLLYMSM